jgi:hypothetical protein
LPRSEREQFGGQDPGVLGDTRCRGDVSRGEPADLMFRFPGGAGGGSGGDVHVVGVNVGLASMSVRSRFSELTQNLPDLRVS